MPYLLQINIGPVQSFIKAARRTRDLAFSSSFLVRLARTAARAIKELDEQAELIFPAELEEEAKDVPNKILASISRSPAEIADLVKKAIDAQVDADWDAVVQQIEKKSPFEKEKEKARLQIDDLVEYTAVAVKYANHSNSYEKARRELELLVAARKNTRDFAPASWGSSFPKSSIDGALESVIPEERYPRLSDIESKSEEVRSKARQMVKNLREAFGAGPHEKLSGVDLLKRLGNIENDETGSSFPSTSHMAALSFLKALYTLSGEKYQRAREWKEKYIDLLKTISEVASFVPDILPTEYQDNQYWPEVFSLGIYDGALLFPERFSDVVGDTHLFKQARADFARATKLLDTFLQEIGLRPDPYYVLLMADGDSMGSVVDAQASYGMEQHKALSRALAGFTGSVPTTVKDFDGVCIYAGGDDVLALLPLYGAVQCASRLARYFAEALRTFRNAEGNSPTLSVGLAVVHHLHPLADALEIARHAESRAKGSGKDALAITVQKRGGPPCEVAGKWGVFDMRLERQIELYQKEIIPAGMAYELEEIALRLEAVPRRESNPSISPPHVQYAALRVFQRKLDEAKRREHDTDQIAQALDSLKEMIGLDHLQAVRVGELAKELIVARFFARARLLATGRSEGAIV
ncbi:MAG TPA: type III-B CRISPR-associated protein Cas10/Cmr2 [Ktedonobacteraceae bacterium]|nr:type III-B CRISPR-associated protein Cas10/Cmr2 [Ktedonobacteraceae bacterium]